MSDSVTIPTRRGPLTTGNAPIFATCRRYAASSMAVPVRIVRTVCDMIVVIGAGTERSVTAGEVGLRSAGGGRRRRARPCQQAEARRSDDPRPRGAGRCVRRRQRRFRDRRARLDAERIVRHPHVDDRANPHARPFVDSEEHRVCHSRRCARPQRFVVFTSAAFAGMRTSMPSRSRNCDGRHRPVESLVPCSCRYGSDLCPVRRHGLALRLQVLPRRDLHSIAAPDPADGELRSVTDHRAPARTTTEVPALPSSRASPRSIDAAAGTRTSSAASTLSTGNVPTSSRVHATWVFSFRP